MENVIKAGKPECFAGPWRKRISGLSFLPSRENQNPPPAAGCAPKICSVPCSGSLVPPQTAARPKEHARPWHTFRYVICFTGTGPPAQKPHGPFAASRPLSLYRFRPLEFSGLQRGLPEAESRRQPGRCCSGCRSGAHFYYVQINHTRNRENRCGRPLPFGMASMSAPTGPCRQDRQQSLGGAALCRRLLCRTRLLYCISSGSLRAGGGNARSSARSSSPVRRRSAAAALACAWAA